MSSQYGELRPTNGWDPSGSLRHPCKFQQVSRLGSVTARHLVVGVSHTLRRWTGSATYVRQGGRPSYWALDHILVCSALPSMLWHCWLGVRMSIRLVKKFSDKMFVWLFLWNKVQMICIWSRWWTCHPINSSFIKIQTGLTFLSGCPCKQPVRWVFVFLAPLMASKIERDAKL